MKGDVRYIGHVIDLAIQEALMTSKAEPAEGTETYRINIQLCDSSY
jgi:hypothetical protein